MMLIQSLLKSSLVFQQSFHQVDQMVQKNLDEPLTQKQIAFLDSFTSTKRILLTANLFNVRENGFSMELHNQRKITQKMRNKLVAWLQKLSISVFGFQRRTLITAIIILDHFLSLYDDDPSTLQMLGCASLLIASKLRETTIVAVDCYITASCKIFTKDQLLEKQRILCSMISWKKIAQGPQKAINRACIFFNAQEKQKNAQKALNFALSKKSSNLFKISDLVCFCISCCSLGLQADQQLLSLAI